MKRSSLCILAMLVGTLAACSSEEEKSGEVEIVSFQASPATVAPGWKSTLTWKAKNATRVEILGDGERLLESVQNSGSYGVTPKVTTTYMLRATGASGSQKELEVVVTVDKGDRTVPEVTFAAGASRIDFQGSTTLTWTTQDAVRIVVSAVGGAVLYDTDLVSAGERRFSGDLEVKPSKETTYQLAAISADGGERKVTAEVIVDPVIVVFGSTTEEPLVEGADVVLSWVTKGAETLTIQQTGGPAFEIGQGERGGGTLRLPASTGIFWMEATRGNGRASAVLTMEVMVDDTPTIVSFKATPDVTTEGEEVVFAWEVMPGPSGADPSLELHDEGGRPYELRELRESPTLGAGSVALPLAGIHTFTLTARSGGSVAATSVQVEAAPRPVITSFYAAPNPILPGDRTTLWWFVPSASEAWIDLVGPEGAPTRLHSIPRFQLMGGSFEVTPSGPGPSIYRITAVNTLGFEVSLEETVEIMAQAEGIVSFGVPASPVQAGDTITVSWEAAGGPVTLTPFLGPAIENTATSSFVDIGSTGVPLTLLPCGTDDDWTPAGKALEDGCATVGFPAAFTFPFDGVERTAVDAYLNGFLSFDVGRNPGENYQNYEGFPADSDYVHLAPFWNDLTIDNNPNPNPRLVYGNPSAPGEPLVVQWSQAHINYAGETDLNFQVALWPNGAVDFRYGSITAVQANLPEWLDGLWAVIGFQDTTLTHWDMLSPWDEAMPGGLTGRSWRYFEREVDASGSETFTVDKTTIFTLCVSLPSGRQCEKRVVTVQ